MDAPSQAPKGIENHRLLGKPPNRLREFQGFPEASRVPIKPCRRFSRESQIPEHPTLKALPFVMPNWPDSDNLPYLYR